MGKQLEQCLARTTEIFNKAVMKATEEVLLKLASIEKGEVAILDLNPPNPQDIEDSDDEAEVPEVPWCYHRRLFGEDDDSLEDEVFEL